MEYRTTPDRTGGVQTPLLFHSYTVTGDTKNVDRNRINSELHGPGVDELYQNQDMRLLMIIIFFYLV